MGKSLEIAKEQANGAKIGKSKIFVKVLSVNIENFKTKEELLNFKFLRGDTVNKKDVYTPQANVTAQNWRKTMNDFDKTRDPVYRAGTSFQSQRLSYK